MQTDSENKSFSLSHHTDANATSFCHHGNLGYTFNVILQMACQQNMICNDNFDYRFI
jgi:hypothetical protein